MEKMQAQVDDYISQFKVGYFSPMTNVVRMTEELGELAREVNHHYGEKQKKPSEATKAIEEELGDVLFVLITLANSLDVSLSDAFQMVMDKYEVRDANRFERKD